VTIPASSYRYSEGVAKFRAETAQVVGRSPAITESDVFHSSSMNQLALPSSFRDDAEAFLQGECVLLRFPMILDIALALPDDTAPTGSGRLPPTSNASSPQHFAFIRSAVLRDNASYDIVAYPVISFSHQGGALEGYNNLPANVKPFLIPLPPLSTHHPTPVVFGNALTLIGGFALGRDSWLHVIPHRFTMPENRQVSLHFCCI
jgi:hypothetical protein